MLNLQANNPYSLYSFDTDPFDYTSFDTDPSTNLLAKLQLDET